MSETKEQKNFVCPSCGEEVPAEDMRIDGFGEDVCLDCYEQSEAEEWGNNWPDQI